MERICFCLLLMCRCKGLHEVPSARHVIAYAFVGMVKSNLLTTC